MAAGTRAHDADDGGGVLIAPATWPGGSACARPSSWCGSRRTSSRSTCPARCRPGRAARADRGGPAAPAGRSFAALPSTVLPESRGAGRPARKPGRRRVGAARRRRRGPDLLPRRWADRRRRSGRSAPS
ncbi:hypothetical protein HBB16_11295 [Pseudonocardia sp. MCCB 268]|nr:hypothetical protein [Pseudonocardia cytotoxica]